MKLDLATLRNGYREGRFTPADVVREAWKRIRKRGERPVWIHLVQEEESVARADALTAAAGTDFEATSYRCPRRPTGNAEAFDGGHRTAELQRAR